MSDGIHTGAEAHDWTALRRLAETATRGTWLRWSDDIIIKDSDGDDLVICGVGKTAAMRSHPYSVTKRQQTQNNAAYIAAANPVAVLALLARAEQAEAERDRLREQVVLLEATGAEAADEIDRLRTALRDLLDLCSHADFKNGVTDATGTMDEGEHWAAVFIDRARAALREGRT